MNVYDAILNDFPTHAYRFTANAASYANIMGGSEVLTTTASRYDTPLVVGDTKPLVLGGTVTAKIPCPRFNQATTGLPFTLEAWVNLLTAGPISIMSHASSTDGLYFDGDYITFGSTTEKASWPVPDFRKTYHVVGVYDDSKVSLWIDGKMVAEQAITTDLPNFADSFLYAGASAAGQSMLFEAPAVYAAPLSANKIARHYEYGRSMELANDLVGRYSGALYKFTDTERDVLTTIDVNWLTAGLGDFVDPSDWLYPATDENDLTLAGTYTFSVPIADFEGSPTNIQGIKLDWNGDGAFVVQFSLDNGGTWNVASNNAVLAGTVNMLPQVTPLIKIIFPAGVAKGDVLVRDMKVTVYSSDKVRAVNNGERLVQLYSTATTTDEWQEPIDGADRNGLYLTGPGYAKLLASAETPVNTMAAIEFWFRMDGPVTSSPSYLMDNRSAGTAYIWASGTNALNYAGFSQFWINGVSTASAALIVQPGRWYHVVANFTSANDFPITLGKSVAENLDGTIGQMTVYPTALTAAQALSLYSGYFGQAVMKVDDTNPVVLTETAAGTKVYAHDWSITGAGG